MKTVHIYPIPYSLRGNEYLERIYSSVQGRVQEDAVFRVEPFSFMTVLRRAISRRDRQIVHIHWETNIYGSAYAIVSIIRGAYRFAGLFLLKLFGVRILWTMHNRHAHDYPHPRIDAVGRAIMRHLADTIIIQEPVAAAEYAARFPSLRIISIPHPDWIGAYGERFDGDRAALRSSYGFSDDDIVLLVLGGVRPYKNVPAIIEAFARAHEREPRLRLLIAGKGERVYMDELERRSKAIAGITLRRGFVDHAEVPPLLALADYSVLYFDDSSLTSGAIILSLSYGTPVIARDAPPSAIVQEGKNGFLFTDATALEALLVSLPSKPRLAATDCIASVSGRSPKSVGDALIVAYDELFVQRIMSS